VRNPRQEDVKRLLTNLINTPKESVTEAPRSTAAGVKKQSGNANTVTSVDHTNLAMCIGKDNLGEGYEWLQKMSEGEINILASRLKKDPSAADSIRLQVDVRLRTWETINTTTRL
jgi:hypothetical protein